MSMDHRTLILCYDIACDRRRRRIASIAEDHGVRLQQSVFEIHISPGRLGGLMSRLNSECKPAEDSIMLLPACKVCLAMVQVIGRSHRASPATHLVA